MRDLPIELPRPFDVEEINLPNDTIIISGEEVVIDLGISNSDWEVSWSGSGSISCDTCPVVDIRPEDDTEFALFLQHISGCTAEHQFQVLVKSESKLYIPNVFSISTEPVWQVFHSKNIELSALSIYDRWGNLVYDSTTDFSWDGTVNGKSLEQGVYLYKIRYSDSDTSDEIVFGSITLLK